MAHSVTVLYLCQNKNKPAFCLFDDLFVHTSTKACAFNVKDHFLPTDKLFNHVRHGKGTQNRNIIVMAWVKHFGMGQALHETIILQF